jgi:hypothetical protein
MGNKTKAANRLAKSLTSHTGGAWLFVPGQGGSSQAKAGCDPGHPFRFRLAITKPPVLSPRWTRPRC